MNVKKRVSPRVLYPMTTIESIVPKVLEHIIQEIKKGAGIPAIRVVDFKGYYIIWEGNYEMLAANIVGKEQVDIEIISLNQQADWLSEENLEEQLKAVGMNAIYDFEALGGFKYLEYPTFYERD